jgi:hypothetical protein
MPTGLLPIPQRICPLATSIHKKPKITGPIKYTGVSHLIIQTKKKQKLQNTITCESQHCSWLTFYTKAVAIRLSKTLKSKEVREYVSDCLFVKYLSVCFRSNLPGFNDCSNIKNYLSNKLDYEASTHTMYESTILFQLVLFVQYR